MFIYLIDLVDQLGQTKAVGGKTEDFQMIECSQKQ